MLPRVLALACVSGLLLLGDVNCRLSSPSTQSRCHQGCGQGTCYGSHRAHCSPKAAEAARPIGAPVVWTTDDGGASAGGGWSHLSGDGGEEVFVGGRWGED